MNTMLVIFLIWKGVVHREFVLKERTVNSEFYREVMDWLLKRLRHIRPDMEESGSWFLQHSNASSHYATISKQSKTLPFLTTPPYSPDLAPADYFWFPKVRSNLKGRCFSTISGIQNNVTSDSESITAPEFCGDIQKFYATAIRCIELGGLCVEG
jgi:transposase